jgi:hypothetical protein
MAERERFGQLRRRVLSTLVERSSCDPEPALGHARALAAADPLSQCIEIYGVTSKKSILSADLK